MSVFSDHMSCRSLQRNLGKAMARGYYVHVAFFLFVQIFWEVKKAVHSFQHFILLCKRSIAVKNTNT